MKRKQINDFLWQEKYRPQSIKDVILPKDLKLYFKNLIKQKDMPSLLMYSSNPGSGKTATAKALCNDIGADYLYINASKDSGIDTLRTRIEKYATTKSLTKKAVKIVILDEFDGVTPQLQKALRGFIEEFHRTCRFILTANYITKIIEPIQSRCHKIDFNMTDIKRQSQMIPSIEKRLIGILKNEKIDYDIETIKTLVKTSYPDIRSMVKLCQQYSLTNGSIDKDIFSFQEVDDEFFEMVKNKQLTKARTYLIEKNYDYDEIFTMLYKNFVPMLDKQAQAQVILIIAEYMKNNGIVVDKEINAMAMLIEIIGVI